jgi:hypothetical protein
MHDSMVGERDRPVNPLDPCRLRRRSHKLYSAALERSVPKSPFGANRQLGRHRQAFTQWIGGFLPISLIGIGTYLTARLSARGLHALIKTPERGKCHEHQA